MTARASELLGDQESESDTTVGLTRELETIKEERDYLLAHSRNLEIELRRVALQSGRIRELELRLADAEARLRRVSVVDNARRLILDPYGTLRRVYRRFRDGMGWRLREASRVFRLKRRRSGA